MGCYIWYSKEGPGWAMAPPSPLLAVPNVTTHPSTARVPITVLLYDGPLFCSFNVAMTMLGDLAVFWLYVTTICSFLHYIKRLRNRNFPDIISTADTRIPTEYYDITWNWLNYTVKHVKFTSHYISLKIVHRVSPLFQHDFSMNKKYMNP